MDLVTFWWRWEWKRQRIASLHAHVACVCKQTDSGVYVVTYITT